MIKDPYLQSVVQINCIPALIIVFFIFFLKINYSYEKPLTKKFIPSVILLLLLIIVDNMDYYCYDSNMFEGTGGLIHRLSAMLGYDMRILLMASLIAIAAARISEKKYIIQLVCLPAVLNVLVLLPCLFTDLFFYYLPDGSIGRGPLAYEPHILSGLYMIFLFVLAFLRSRKGRSNETGILLLCGALTILGFLAEFLFALRGILTGVVALDIAFYYLYLHIEHFRFDPLTLVFNREAFMADIGKNGKGEITHILSIDLNDLKKLNDSKGHNEGDKALKSIAKALSESCLPDCSVYRVGGDEYSIICKHCHTEDIEVMIGKMYEAVRKSGYSCAIGYAEWTAGKSFTEVYKAADDRMYIKKRNMKSGTEESVRFRAEIPTEQ